MKRWSELREAALAFLKRKPTGEALAVVEPKERYVWILDGLDEGSTPLYTRHTIDHDARSSIADVLRDLDVDPELLLYASIRGERIRPDDTMTLVVDEPWWVRGLRKLFGISPLTYEVNRFEHEIIGDDQLFLVPLLQGKNASLILGVIGAVIGFYLAGPGGASAGWTWGAALSGAALGFSIGSYIGTLMTPQPSAGKGDKSLTTYGWNGIQNEYRNGATIPIAIGKHKNAPVRVGMYVTRFTEVINTGFEDLPNDGSKPYRQSTSGESLYLLFLLSIGPINSVSDIRINGQPYTNFGGNVTIETRLGVPGQTKMPGFNDVITTTPQATELTASFTIYTTTRQIEAFEVLFTIPGLYHFDSKGNMVNNQTHYRVEYRKVGTTTWLTDAFFDRRMNGSTRSSVRDTMRKDNLEKAFYEIRYRWFTSSTSYEHNDPQKDGWKVFVTGINEITYGAPTYDFGTHQYAMMGVRAVAMDKLSGGVPLVTCVTEGILMQQYNGSTLTAPTYSRNPAWAALYLFLNTAVGAGNWIEGVEELDLQSFKDWADYCDELVTVTPDSGPTFQEKRHQLDVIINQQRPFLDVLLDLCATARATPVMVGEKWKMVVDRPGVVRQTFTGPGNIIEGSLSIAYRSDAQRVNSFDVSIMEEANDWNVEPFRIKSNYLVNTLGDPVRPEPITLWGITRRTQAFRDVTFRLNGLAFLRRLAQFLAFTDAILIEAGDVIAIAHDVPQWGFPGRAKSGTTTSITLDRSVVIEVGKTYEVLVRFQDGSNGAGDIRTVTTAPGTTNVLTWTTPLAKAVGRDDIYAFGPLALSTKPYRVIAITRSASGIRRIVALEYYATLYDDSGIVTIPIYSQLPNLYAPPPALSNLTLTELVEERTDLSRPSTLLIQWDRPLPVAGKGVFEGCRLDRSWDNGNTWELLGYFVGVEHRWQNAPQKVPISIRATPRSTKGVFNDAGALTQSITLNGWTTPPGDVVALPSVAKDGRFIYSWVPATRAIQYEVRMTNTGWGLDQNFVYRDHGTTFEIPKPLARSVTIHVRAVDQFGNYSANTTSIVCTDSAPAAPTPLTGSIVATTEVIKIPVQPPADTDVVALHLHASTLSGFVPLSTNRVASVVSAKGGDFIFRPPAGSAGPWFFKVTAEDPLSARLDDWVYSSQFSASLLVITPQNPSGVSFSQSGTPVRRRAVRSGSGPTTPQQKPFSVFVNWTFSDSVNPASSLDGFTVIVFLATGGDPSVPYWSSGKLGNPAQRSCGIPDLEIDDAATYVAAVKANYIDAISSPYVTSNNMLLDPTTGEPVIQTGDDRNVAGYAETFDAATIPAGFTTTGIASKFVANSALICNVNNVSTASITWDIWTWANEYLDQKRGGPFAVLVALNLQGTSGFNLAAASITFNDGVNPAVTRSLSLQAGLDQHIYRVEFTDKFLPYASGSTPTIKLNMGGVWPSGSPQFSLMGIAICFDDTDWAIDGKLDRALKARAQFGRDPLGGGYFLGSPVRLAGDDGSINLFTDNGSFYLRNDFGDLITETPYKFGREYSTHLFGSGAFVAFDGEFNPQDPVNNYGINDPWPVKPVAMNKTRWLLSKTGGSVLDSQPTSTQYPIREYLEIQPVEDGFYASAFMILGGVASSYVVDLAFNTRSTQQKDFLFLNSNDSIHTTDGPNDAWYFVWDDSGVPNGEAILGGSPTGSTGLAQFYRTVVWFEITVPYVTKSDGSTYWCEFRITVHRGEGRTDSGNNRMNLIAPGTNQPDPVTGYFFSGGYERTYSRIPFRFQSDGRTYRVPVVLGNFGAADGYKRVANIKADWQAFSSEGNAVSSFSCTVRMPRITYHYVNNCKGIAFIDAQTWKIVYVEEYS